MIRVMLFGSGSLPEITAEVANAILSLVNESESTGTEIEFIVGDGAVQDQAYNRYLSRAGLTNITTVYGIGHVRNNNYGHKECVLTAAYNESTHKCEIYNNGNILYEFDVKNKEDMDSKLSWGDKLDKCMARISDIAICLWDGKTKTEEDTMQYFSITGKPCYVYKLDI